MITVKHPLPHPQKGFTVSYGIKGENLMENAAEDLSFAQYSCYFYLAHIHIIKNSAQV